MPGMRILAAITALILAAPAWTDQPSGVTARLRGVSAVSDRVAWASGSAGTVLRTEDGGATWQSMNIPGAEKLDFRDIDAVSDDTAYVLEHRLRRELADLQDHRRRPDLDAAVHQHRSEGVLRRDGFLGRDSRYRLQRFGRRTARDSANGRRRRLVDARPGCGTAARARERRRIRGERHERRGDGRDHVWIGTSPSRESCDRATADSPGRPRQRRWPAGPSSGIFSIAFRDADHGIVVGGDYRKENEAIDNAAITNDGGRTWTKVTGLSGFRSVVSYLPGASTPTLIAVGPQGADQSTDDGRTWTPLPGASGLHTFAFAKQGRAGWGAGEKGRIMRLLY